MNTSQFTIDVRFIPQGKNAPVVDVKIILNGVIVYTKQTSAALLPKGDDLSIEQFISNLLGRLPRIERLTGYHPKEQKQPNS